MNEPTITDLTRRLIEACGGLETASRKCRYSVPQLSRCQTENSGCFLALDVVIALEAYCKQPIISRAMLAATPDTRPASDIRDEASEAFEACADMHRVVRLADRTPRGRKTIRQAVARARDELRDVEAALEAEETAVAS
ncbi:hypothetical protein [Brevundimonas balnearis]|uniref:Uncharacterized protein n=1 Tax=Brevundimonas balnearis TaxID=1572858 RepID=A0ABV6R0W7_9CAUL